MINHSPTVSIGLPVFNGEKHIIESIDALLAQNFTNFELIISDNASSDSTEVICKNYAANDARIKYFRQIKNLGAVENFKYVLKKATGKYFMWCAADDYLTPNTGLYTLVSALERGSDYAMTDVRIFDQGNNIFIRTGVDSYKYKNSVYEKAKASILANNYGFYSLFKINVARANFKYIEECKEFKCFNEGLFVHALVTNYSGTFVSEATLVYRRHEENASSKQPSSALIFDFFKYSLKSLSFFIKTKYLTWDEKSLIILGLLYCHIKYEVYLGLAACKQLIKKSKQ